jgi:hypothetical protein
MDEVSAFFRRLMDVQQTRISKSSNNRRDRSPMSDHRNNHRSQVIERGTVTVRRIDSLLSVIDPAIVIKNIVIESIAIEIIVKTVIIMHRMRGEEDIRRRRYFCNLLPFVVSGFLFHVRLAHRNALHLLSIWIA